MKIGLVSHLIKDYNLGCSALAISNIKILDEIFKEKKINVEYVVILAEAGFERDVANYTSLQGYTDNKFSYRTYPRPKNMLMKPWLLKTTQAFDDCDFIIDLCGGDGYTDNYGVKRILAESIPVFGSEMHGVRSIFGPQTIGPFNTKIGKLVAKSTLSKLNTIYVRDEKSFICCKELGFEEKTIQVIDVAFALPYEKRTLDNKKFNVGINVSGLLYNGGYDRNNYFGLSFDYRKFILSIVEEILKKENVAVHLIPHVVDPEHGVDDDWMACIDVKNKYPQCILPDRFCSASEAKSYISAMDLFSGARMHSTIAATSSGVPVIPVAYSRKFNGLYDTLNYPYYIDAKSNLNLLQAISLFFQYYDNVEKLSSSLKEAKIIYTRELEKYKKSLPCILKIGDY